MLKSFLQGKPFGHPLHPAVVHFPIGLFILSLILDLLGFLMVDNILVRASYYAIATGLAMGLLAVLFGVVDYSDIRSDHPAKRIATRHMLLNFAVLGLSAVNLTLRSGELEAMTISSFPLLLSLAAVAMITYSGYLGGHMVYHDGIGVGRHRRYTDTPDRTILVENGSDFVTVAPLSELKEGSTLRAEASGHVMTIARIGEEIYAVQEFCTHRFGPLSEGKLEGHELICPWHRSCFDLRTGKVIQGPADLDLKSYEARIEGDMVQVRVKAR